MTLTLIFFKFRISWLFGFRDFIFNDVIKIFQVQEDEWIEPVNEQEFVIEGGGIKRLELEEKVKP